MAEVERLRHKFIAPGSHPSYQFRFIDLIPGSGQTLSLLPDSRKHSYLLVLS